jgi:hypothetical protein
LFVQLDRRAASRAICTAGSSKATKIPMMAITTRSSTSVKPRVFSRLFMTASPHKKKDEREKNEAAERRSSNPGRIIPRKRP